MTEVTGYGGGLDGEYCFTLSTLPKPTSLLLGVQVDGRAPTSVAVNSTAPVLELTEVTGYGGGLIAEYCFALSTLPKPISVLICAGVRLYTHPPSKTAIFVGVLPSAVSAVVLSHVPST